MTKSVAQKRSEFHAMHARGCFVLPNPWDVGSARMFEHLGFHALASTSSGYSWSTGRPDYTIMRDDVLAHLAALSAAVDIPVNADFESGFGDVPETIADSVRLAIESGIAALSIEDRDVGADRLYDKATSVERLKAARKAIDVSGTEVLLVARTEGLLLDPNATMAAIDKLVAFADAGADCLYAPGVVRKEDIATMVRAVAPKPLNVLVMDPTIALAEYADLGVRRVSVGGALAGVGWAAVMSAARAMLDGRFSPLGGRASGAELNHIFAHHREP
jgi:2-methylisocitrate lyase-like PEP mutase family enzyme